MKSFLRNNGLSLAPLVLFLLCYSGQSHSPGCRNLEEHGKPPQGLFEYAKSSEFLEANAENWESEFLQLFTFVV